MKCIYAYFLIAPASTSILIDLDFQALFQDKMAYDPTPFMNIPVAILIFDNQGVISYRAYSPREYHFLPDGSNPDHRDGQFGQFLAHLYYRIAYDVQNPMNNNTNFGQLKEIHTRHVQIPIADRHNTCYFTTYIHPHTLYKPVHRNSPVFFDQDRANNYINQQPNLFHLSCQHEFV